MPRKKYSNSDIAIIVFLILGALGLTKLAEWWLRNVIIGIDDIVSVLEWLSNINSMDLIPMLISYAILIIGIYVSGLLIKNILDRIRSFFNNHF